MYLPPGHCRPFEPSLSRAIHSFPPLACPFIATPNARDANDATLLHLASGSMWWGGRPDIVQLLLHYGSDIHAWDDKIRLH